MLKENKCMFEKKFLDFLIENNIDINSIIRNNRIEARKLKNVIEDCTLIDTKTLTVIEEGYVELPTGCAIFHIKRGYSRLIYQENVCLLNPKSVVYRGVCDFCQASSMQLCECNNLYRQGFRYVKKGDQ